MELRRLDDGLAGGGEVKAWPPELGVTTSGDGVNTDPLLMVWESDTEDDARRLPSSGDGVCIVV